jgi:hypothetical protein
MAHNAHLANIGANAAADAACALCNGGFLDIYDGAQPATADTALSGQTLLASLALNATAFAASVAGVATANAISSAVAGATSTATWFRVYKSNHTSVVFDGSVGTSGADLNLLSTSIVSGQTVTVTAFTYTQQKS